VGLVFKHTGPKGPSQFTALSYLLFIIYLLVRLLRVYYLLLFIYLLFYLGAAIA